MSEKQLFILAHAEARRRAQQAVQTAPEGFRVVVEPPKRNGEQNDKFHAQIDDIAKQTTYAGRSWAPLHMKRILIDEFAEAMREAGTPLHHDSMLIPSENGKRVIQLEIHSSEFYVREASEFIEFLNAWGADRDVVWSDDAKRDLLRKARARVEAVA